MAFAASALPVILTVASIGLGVAGAAVNTSATIASNNYQSQVLQRNKELMELNAQRAIESSAQEQLKQDQMTRALIGEQLATQSASGLKLGGKSQMLTRKAARELGRLDALNIRHAGEVEAYNFRQMAADASQEIQFRQQSNGYAMLSGFLDAGSAVVGGLRTPGFLDSASSLLGARKGIGNTATKTNRFRFAR